MFFGILFKFFLFFVGKIIFVKFVWWVFNVFFFKLLIGNIWLWSVILFVILIFLFIGIFVSVEISVVVIVIFVDGLFFGIVFFGMWIWILFFLWKFGLIWSFFVWECI